jgi:sulfatase maturation enzyme AslB (radical SAM superfamily)
MYQYAELVHWMKNQDIMKILPAQVDIDLTNVCNQDCFYCNSADFRKDKPVQKKYREYIALLDKLATWRAHTPNSYGTTHTITYPGGGEPTVLVGYEHVIEHTLDLGFLTSITTNGSNLDKLLDSIVVEKLKKIAWVGIDIDAGTEALYEKIRRSLTARSLFNRVCDNALNLIDTGVNVDFKCLINPLNDNQEAMSDLFKLVKKLGGRGLYFRPVIINNQAHPITEQTLAMLQTLSDEFQLPHYVNTNKTLPRNYKKCHQMFHFPVFCADGKIYICCEGKGNPQFELGSWDKEEDFRDLWLNERHYEIYNKTRVEFCQPCRPNISNIQIQNILNNPKDIETLYL